MKGGFLIVLLGSWLVIGCGGRPGGLSDPGTELGEAVDLERARSGQTPARISDLLKGRVAGVRVSDGPQGPIVRIRGSKGDPLYVVDGIPVTADPGGGLAFLNPADVESIRILKNAFGTAQYGFRGANGVIVIRTKTGSSEPVTAASLEDRQPVGSWHP